MSFISLQSVKTGGVQRISTILYVFYFLVGMIVLRFFYLQIIEGDAYYQKSLGNAEREFTIFAPRGLIFDRYGRVVAKNKVAFSLSMIGGYVPRNKLKRTAIFSTIGEKLGISPLVLEKRFLENPRSYQPVLIKENLSDQEIIYFYESESIYPFLSIASYSGRSYPYHEALASVLGYIGAISPSEYKTFKSQGYAADSFIGKSGLEKQYESLLRGQNGEGFKVIDYLGRLIMNEDNRTISPIAGKNLVLSIDAELQDLIYKALQGRRGAVIVTKPATGEVLALVSVPSYDNNAFIDSSVRNKIFSSLLADPNKPFLNRTIQGQYSPGSIFKIVIALSALEDGKLDPNKVEDTHTGIFKLGNHIFKDHGVKQSANLAEALEKSNNIYFYKLAWNLGYSSILDYSTRLGLRSKTNIDLLNEMSNFTPTPEWKEEHYHDIWVDGDTVNIGIGQGFLLLTPLGIHNIISTIASGRVVTPHLVWSEENPYTGVVEKEYETTYISDFQPKESTLDAIREGLARVPYTGTGAYHQYLSKVRIAGKTGTAQTTTMKGTKDNAFFSSYGPTDAPLDQQYAVTVVVESGGFGAGVVPISSEIYNYLTGAQTKEQGLQTLASIFPKIKNLKEED